MMFAKDKKSFITYLAIIGTILIILNIISRNVLEITQMED